jgi:hypothetical protein
MRYPINARAAAQQSGRAEGQAVPKRTTTRLGLLDGRCGAMSHGACVFSERSSVRRMKRYALCICYYPWYGERKRCDPFFERTLFDTALSFKYVSSFSVNVVNCLILESDEQLI